MCVKRKELRKNYLNSRWDRTCDLPYANRML